LWNLFTNEQVNKKGEVKVLKKNYKYFIILFIFASPIAFYLYSTMYGLNFVVSPEISVDGKRIDYIGITRIIGAKPTDPIAEVESYTAWNENVVKPNSKIELLFEDKPKKVFVEKWFNGDLIEKKQKLKELNLTAPSQEGIYIYKLNPRWDFRNRIDIIFTIEVKN
jgi:hypothetical protein